MPNKPKDLTGMQFNDWSVLRYLGNRHWECKCSCGKVVSVHTYKLTSGTSKSCGHYTNSFIDLSGETFGDWAVLSYAGGHKWNCRCTCGNLGTVSSKALRDRKSTSCGHSTTGFKDIANKRFNEWTAIRYLGNTLWECQCSCGTIGTVKLYDLLNNCSKSCGHDTTGFKDLTNQTFGEWKVIEYKGDQKWLCQCSCGTLRELDSQHLRTNRTKSCGCKEAQHLSETSYKKYGVPYSTQRHRTPEQIKMTSSEENLLSTILSNFTTLPTPIELGNLVGLTPHRVMVIVRSFDLENYISLYKATSTYENELAELFPCQHRSDRESLSGQELDLYYPEQNMAIEFNGTYWHSDGFKVTKYHQDKSLNAISKGIRIIHIFEYEWRDQNTKQKLISLLTKSLYPEKQTKIYARKCEINEISLAEANKFIDQNHLQGPANSSIQLGIYYESILIGVMTFGIPRFTDEYEYELIRLAWKPGITCIGGTQRLFKYFLRKYQPSSIITYSDISKFSGRVYESLGFKDSGITSPNYKWVNPSLDIVLSRYKTTKQKLIKANLGTEDETESEIMRNNGYLKIYDCGNRRYTWKNECKEVG